MAIASTLDRSTWILGEDTTEALLHPALSVILVALRLRRVPRARVRAGDQVAARTLGMAQVAAGELAANAA